MRKYLEHTNCILFKNFQQNENPDFSSGRKEALAKKRGTPVDLAKSFKSNPVHILLSNKEFKLGRYLEEDSLRSKSLNTDAILNISEKFSFLADYRKRTTFNADSNNKTILGTKDNKTWRKASLNTEAQERIARLKRARSYCGFVGANFKPKSNKSSKRYTSSRQKSLGSTNIRISILLNLISFQQVDVLQASVQFLI